MRAAVLAAVGVVLGAATAFGAADAFVVPTAATTSGFGPFTESDTTPAAAALRTAFGPPDRTVAGRRQTCVMTWRRLGIRARVFRVGDAPDPCRSGELSQVRLTDRRWHSPTGVRVGSSAAAARRVALRRCVAQTPGCGVNGYALELHRTDCAAGRVAGVIAEIARGRVIALIVRSRRCE